MKFKYLSVLRSGRLAGGLRVESARQGSFTFPALGRIGLC